MEMGVELEPSSAPVEPVSVPVVLLPVPVEPLQEAAGEVSAGDAALVDETATGTSEFDDEPDELLPELEPEPEAL